MSVKLVKDVPCRACFYTIPFLTVVFAAVIISFIHFYSLKQERSYAKFSVEADVKLYNDFMSGLETEKRIIMLGNSRLRNASRAGVFIDTFEGYDPRTVRVLQYSQDGAVFSDYLHLSKAMLDNPPEVVIIMQGLLSNSRVESSALTRLSARFVGFINEFMQERSREDLWLYKRSYLMSDCFSSFASARIRQHLTLLSTRDVHLLQDNTHRDRALTFVESMLQKGVRVFVLNIHANNEMLSKVGVVEHLVDYPGLGYIPSQKELLPQKYDEVEWLEYFGSSGESEFCDIVHLNDFGRSNFDVWFRDTVIDHILK